MTDKPKGAVEAADEICEFIAKNSTLNITGEAKESIAAIIAEKVQPMERALRNALLAVGGGSSEEITISRMESRAALKAWKGEG